MELLMVMLGMCMARRLLGWRSWRRGISLRGGWVEGGGGVGRRMEEKMEGRPRAYRVGLMSTSTVGYRSEVLAYIITISGILYHSIRTYSNSDT